MRLRVAVVADGITLPDQYFDHPQFVGQSASVTIYAETLPAQTNKFTPTGTVGTNVAAGAFNLSAATGVFSPNDSHAPTHNSPSLT